MKTNTPALCILGTDTGIGKTYVTCLLARRLRERGLRVGVCKPFATGGKKSRHGILCDDTLRLRAAAGSGATPAQITPVALRAPLAPNWAARLERKTIDLKAATGAVRDMAARCDVLLIEGIGGALVPLTDTVTFADFLAGLGIPAWIVARRGLGTLNHTLLTLEALRARGIPVAGILLNAGPRRGGDLSERSNAANLRAVTGMRAIFELPCRPSPRTARQIADRVLRLAMPRMRRIKK